jgi:hypothetical protein
VDCVKFLVELYLPSHGADAAAATAARARAAADELAGQGAPVRYLRMLYVPDDETCFLLYEAASAELAGEASQRAQIAYERVLEAVEGGDL